MDMFVTAAGMLAFVKSVVDFVRYLRARNTGWITQLAVWVAGIGVVVAFSHSDFAESVAVAGVSLATAGWGTLVLAGLGLGSSAMLTNDFKQAIDTSDSAVKPPLVG
jgi:hypothetical protein